MTSVDGTVVVSGDVAVIGFERLLRHPVDTVWAALTEPGQLESWLGPGSLDAFAGGAVSIRTGPPASGARGHISGAVLTWDPPHVLEYEWRQPGLAVSVVRYELEPQGIETILRLTHRRSVVAEATGGRAGWHAYLDRLGAYLDGEPVPAWLERRAAVQDAYGEAPIHQP